MRLPKILKQVLSSVLTANARRTILTQWKSGAVAGLTTKSSSQNPHPPTLATSFITYRDSDRVVMRLEISRIKFLVAQEKYIYAGLAGNKSICIGEISGRKDSVSRSKPLKWFVEEYDFMIRVSRNTVVNYNHIESIGGAGQKYVGDVHFPSTKYVKTTDNSSHLHISRSRIKFVSDIWKRGLDPLTDSTPLKHNHLYHGLIGLCIIVLIILAMAGCQSQSTAPVPKHHIEILNGVIIGGVAYCDNGNRVYGSTNVFSCVCTERRNKHKPLCR